MCLAVSNHTFTYNKAFELSIKSRETCLQPFGKPARKLFLELFQLLYFIFFLIFSPLANGIFLKYPFNTFDILRDVFLQNKCREAATINVDKFSPLWVEGLIEKAAVSNFMSFFEVFSLLKLKLIIIFYILNRSSAFISDMAKECDLETMINSARTVQWMFSIDSQFIWLLFKCWTFNSTFSSSLRSPWCRQKQQN